MLSKKSDVMSTPEFERQMPEPTTAQICERLCRQNHNLYSQDEKAAESWSPQSEIREFFWPKTTGRCGNSWPGACAPTVSLWSNAPMDTSSWIISARPCSQSGPRDST